MEEKPGGSPATGASDLEKVESSVPPAMVEPAQALEAATGAGVAAAAGAAAAPVLQQNIVITQRRHGPGLIVRALWYLFVGWWLTGIAIAFPAELSGASAAKQRN